MLASQKIRVGVLRGGPSPEYAVSLETGKNVLQSMQNLSEHYTPIDIFIDRNGRWHQEGVVRDPENILKKLDVAFNALHGKYGEDGEVQRLMDHFSVPYTGSDAMASAVGMNKILSKKIYRDNNIKTPFSVHIPFESLSREAIRTAYGEVPMPFIIKPSSAGSSVGVRVARSLPELEEAVLAAFEYSPSVLIEEYIEGKEATCGVIDNFRNEEYYALPPIEIKFKSNLFDYHSKYSDSGTEEICPGNFSKEEKRQIENMAKSAHRSLGLRHYSRSDFRIHPKRGIFILETNTLPGLTRNSLIPKSLEAVGSSIGEFLHHVIQSALQNKQ